MRPETAMYTRNLLDVAHDCISRATDGAERLNLRPSVADVAYVLLQTQRAMDHLRSIERMLNPLITEDSQHAARLQADIEDGDIELPDDLAD